MNFEQYEPCEEVLQLSELVDELAQDLRVKGLRPTCCYFGQHQMALLERECHRTPIMPYLPIKFTEGRPTWRGLPAIPCGVASRIDVGTG